LNGAVWIDPFPNLTVNLIPRPTDTRAQEPPKRTKVLVQMLLVSSTPARRTGAQRSAFKSRFRLRLKGFSLALVVVLAATTQAWPFNDYLVHVRAHIAPVGC